MTDHTSPEPPPEETETERLRDSMDTLQTIVNRVREAVGTDQPAPAEARVHELEQTARVLSALHRSAEDTVTRVIDLYESWVHAGPPPLGASMARWWDKRLVELRAALQADSAQPAPAGHRYLSTGCLHGDHTLTDGRTGHQYCQSATGKTGDKQPAQCKFCAAPCVCGCHNQPAPAVPAAPEPVDWRRVLDGFQALLKAFPADLHPGGPAVSCRPQPAGLVARWRDTVRTARQQTADQTTEK